ncbi:malto-oligosyltrehalose trehalohydrolase [Nitrospira sp. Nam80]
MWAPNAGRVDIIFLDGEYRRIQRMAPESHKYFQYREDNVPEGRRYVYSLDNGPDRPDPASRWQPDGVNRPSAVLRASDFVWTDHAWSGVARQDLVFYEIHVGTFTDEGTFESIIPRLSSLQDLGITAIELMPVAQFPGCRNWGYDGVHPFAVQNSYGGPHGLQRLVNACHEQGLSIFLDVVYNHIGPEGSCLSEFGSYFTDRYRTPWGHAMNFDGPGSDAVRGFVLDSVRMWIKDYHMDGLRLDAVHAIYDGGVRHILRDIKEAAELSAGNRTFPVHIVAESDLNDVRILLPVERGGYGLDAQWSDDYHHAVHALLTKERQGYYADYGQPEHVCKAVERTFVLDGCYSGHRDRRHGGPDQGLPGDRFVVCIQNHDQVGNRALGERLGTLLALPAQRLAAVLLLMAPHLPLLFMGEEYGEEHPFQYFCSFEEAELIENVRRGRKQEFEAFHAEGAIAPDPQSEFTFAQSRLTWAWVQPHKEGLRCLYHDLLDARRSWPALRNFAERAAKIHRGLDGHAVLEIIRGGVEPETSRTVQLFSNLTAETVALPAVENDTTVLFSSESRRYDGRRTPSNDATNLLPFECLVYGPENWKHYLQFQLADSTNRP